MLQTHREKRLAGRKETSAESLGGHAILYLPWPACSETSSSSLGMLLLLLLHGAEANCATSTPAEQAAYSEVQALMDVVKRRGNAPHGGVGNYCGQLRAYMQVAVQAAAQASRYLQVCEIGFGSGMSTVLFLAASPRTRVLTFDLFPGRCARTRTSRAARCRS